ncbi:aryl-alcohol dehydrogenase-like predicted oxidoreductase [Aliiruegeria haliotis]|uniref:Aryl-alcohol dehydrogenase-like predicted oxidoreductase n=1 Tax=Aliiruegeria haliotis TaxID=1280846 RepID=A0A2T0RWH6_9RHOB|nr:aldo/keto reductase [Aliiruegeria haliotis]PRY25510.1 aryl-alcohol dehydrogenase-like predicted oxidoreductase [Aliiruegeria haliotis]
MTLDLNSNPRLGLGCWAIGGPFWEGETPLGYGEIEDSTSIRAIHAALDAGVRFFDTASVYGAGHSEVVLGEALAGRDHVVISTKIGPLADERSKQVTGAITSRDEALAEIDRCLHRLGRDHVDMVFLHLNEMSPDDALQIFDALESAREVGKIGNFGWSTDFPDSVRAYSDWRGFTAVQHTMNLWVPASQVLDAVEENGLLSVNRMPLAQGVFAGKYTADTTLQPSDIRTNSLDWMEYFKGGKVVPEVLDMLEAVRELLQTDGRTVAQGALGWIWAKSPNTCPIPGFRTVEQAEQNARALEFGPLPDSVMAEIEALVSRPPEGAPRAR